VFTLDNKEEDLHTFLQAFKLNKERYACIHCSCVSFNSSILCSIESGSILHLSENEPFSGAMSAEEKLQDVCSEVDARETTGQDHKDGSLERGLGDAGPVIEQEGTRVFEVETEASPPNGTADSPMLMVKQEESLVDGDRHGAGWQDTKLPIKASFVANIPLSSDSNGRSPKTLRPQASLAPTMLSPVRRPIIMLAVSSSAASEPSFSLEGTFPRPSMSLPLLSPMQSRHEFGREYTLPPLKLLPLEYNRKGRSTKLQRKREKGRDKTDGKRDKDGTRDDWYPLGLNRWSATVSANPVWKRVSRASKCLSTREWAVSAPIITVNFCLALDRLLCQSCG